jgi:hypothetical protein
MGPHQHVDRIDLEQVRALQHAAHVPPGRRGRAVFVKSLGGERNASGLGETEFGAGVHGDE